MAERYTKMVKTAKSLDEALSAVEMVLSTQKMNIKKKSVGKDSFTVNAAEKTNFLSTNWPAKVEVTGKAMGDNVIISIELASSMGSITQAQANSSKLEQLASNLEVMLS